MSSARSALRRLIHSVRSLTVTSSVVLIACDADEPTGTRRVVTAVTVSLEPATVEVGQTIAASAVAVDQHGLPIRVHSLQWTSARSEVAGVDDGGRVRAVGPGVARIVVSADGVVGQGTITVNAPPAIRISRIETGGATNAGWVELFNPTGADVDLSWWTMIDGAFFGHAYPFPERTTISSGSSLVIQERSLPFAIDAVDDVRLLSRYGVEVDRMLWIVPR